MKRPGRTVSILESLLWVFCYQFSQLLILGMFFALTFTATFGTAWPSQSELVQLVLDLNWDRSFILIGVTCLGGALLVMPLIRLRLGKEFRKVIGWDTPRHEEVIFAMATVIPIAILGDLLFDLSRDWWRHGQLQDFLTASFRVSSLEYLSSTLHTVPYMTLVIALALGPAVAEELIFRGIIGRSLVNRMGTVRGSIITALLFSIAHMSPAHAVATLPIAFLLQYLYLKTGTIWIPILVHFCNNLLAVTMIRFEFTLAIPLTPMIGVAFGVYLGIILLVFESRQKSWELRSVPLR